MKKRFGSEEITNFTRHDTLEFVLFPKISARVP